MRRCLLLLSLLGTSAAGTSSSAAKAATFRQQDGGRRGFPGGRGGQGRGGQGRGRGAGAAATEPAATDPSAEQREVLDAADEQRVEVLARMVRRVNRTVRTAGLPSSFTDPEAVYGPDYVAFRAKWFGELVRSSVGREALRSATADPAALDAFGSSTVHLVLSDDPEWEDVEALLAGYSASDRGSRALGSLARCAGRAAARLVESGRASAAEVDRVAEVFAADLRSDDDVRIAAALDGLSRLGRGEVAEEFLVELATGEREDGDCIALLYECRRLIDSPAMDPAVKEAALGRARRVLEAGPPSGRSEGGRGVSALFPGLDAASSAMRSALTLLVQLDPEGSVEDVENACSDRTTLQRLGMDGLQQLRFALQGKRATMSARAVSEFDRFHARVLTEAGERLFTLEEDPMSDEEYQEFFARKDLRYNAASWFVDQWQRFPEVTQALHEEPDAPEFLALLRDADTSAEPVAGIGRESVREKDETRLLCGMILARLAKEEDRPLPAGTYARFVRVLAGEVGADADLAAELAAAQGKDGVKRVWLEIPLRREPDDAWVRDKALDALDLIGAEVVRTGTGSAAAYRVLPPAIYTPPHGE